MSPQKLASHGMSFVLELCFGFIHPFLSGCFMYTPLVTAILVPYSTLGSSSFWSEVENKAVFNQEMGKTESYNFKGIL